jgi:hypothetical protein
MRRCDDATSLVDNLFGHYLNTLALFASSLLRFFASYIAD